MLETSMTNGCDGVSVLLAAGRAPRGQQGSGEHYLRTAQQREQRALFGVVITKTPAPDLVADDYCSCKFGRYPNGRTRFGIT
jgi:hypothetical protein